MYCRHCGASIPDDSTFCYACGKPLKDNKLSNDDNSNKYKVRIYRESQTYLLNPPINITINDSTKLSIENGGTRELELNAGDYEILFSLNIRSTKLKVILDKNINITLKVSRMTGSIKAEFD